MDQRTESEVNEAGEFWTSTVEASDGSLAAVLDEDPSSTISTCPQCRAMVQAGEACLGCGSDSQAAPGQPIPKELEPEEPKPEEDDEFDSGDVDLEN